MITKTNIILFGTVLMTILFVPLAQNSFAASTFGADKIADTSMVNFLNSVVEETGEKTKSQTLDDTTVSVTNTVSKLSENSYQVDIVGTENGKTTNDQTIIVTQNDDGSVNMINEKMGFNVDFYKSSQNTLVDQSSTIKASYSIGGPQPLGSGSSDNSGARIDLYDSGYRSSGTSIINLDDDYSGCASAHTGEFDASVYTSTTFVDWDGSLLYWNWCINPHTFDNVDVTHEGSTHNYSGTSYRDSTDTYNHSGGSGTFSVEVDMYYGSW